MRVAFATFQLERPLGEEMGAAKDTSEAGTERGVRELAFDIERDLICTTNADGCFASLNAAWERMLGWSREELMARPFLDFVHPDDVERTAREAARVDEPDRELVGLENRYRAKDGSWRWVRWSARSDGTTWFAVGHDITESR